MHAAFLEVYGDARAAGFLFRERGWRSVEEVGKVGREVVYVLADWGLGGA